MYGRRHRLHHAQALSLALLVGTAAWATPAPATRKLAADGTIHLIEVKNPGPSLRHTRTPVGGSPVAVTIPGTTDAAIDREPALEIDPVSGQVVLVWSRYDANNYNVFMSRFNGTTWSAPVAVLKAAGDDVEPQVRISAHYVHVSWRQLLDGETTFFRQSFLSTTLEPADGPEPVRTNDLWPVPTEGSATSSTVDPSTSDEIFSDVTFPPNGPEPGRVHIWGVRDEPVPIGYRECINLPPQVRSATFVEAGFLGGQFTVSYVVGSKFYYASRVNGAWSPTRSLELSGGLTVNDAKWIVLDRNARSSGY